MSKLITARDIAERDGAASVAEWVRLESIKAVQRKQIGRPWDGRTISGMPVMAYVDFGRWAGRCDCGGGTYVDPNDPVFFCMRCGNANSGMARPVIFPVDLDAIEDALLARPVTGSERAVNRIEAARLGRPAIDGLARNWYPNQTLSMLLGENERLLSASGGE